MNNSPIGLFDSGIGGLSVFSQLYKLLPNENYIYFGDTLNLPYGNKTIDELVKITTSIFDFFQYKNVKAVVMACNTTSALTYNILKTKYNFKIFPIVQTVSKQIALQGYKNIGVFATNATINSHAYKKEINSYNPKINVYEIACPNWVNIVENELQQTNDSILDVKNHLNEMLSHSPNKIILGCTHYPYLLKVLSSFAPENLFINPAEYFANDIAENLKSNNMLAEEKQFEPKFYVSSNPKQFMSASKLFFNVQNAEKIQLSDLLVK